MSFSILFIFTLSILIITILYKVLGNRYALDLPGTRKQHLFAISQIGGLFFGPFILYLGWWFRLAPTWYFIGGMVSILLGAIDDYRNVPWQIKLTTQILLCIYISNLFWGRFDSIIFYSHSIFLKPITLFAIFVIWFVGIYNAVNLIDGLDGLAGGYILLLSTGIAMAGLGVLSQLNGLIAVILLAFLVFNQRPAKLFMGDAGSLFLGYHIAVLPLLFADINPNITSFPITPFILLASYLIADTTRVFFTRIADKKSPMTADTIHLHHLILQQSGSYLTSICSIYGLTLLSVAFALFSFQAPLSSNMMFGHMGLLLIFILTPPVQTYVPLINKIIHPFYFWQKNPNTDKPFPLRTLFMIALLLGLVFSLLGYHDFSVLFNWEHGLAIAILFVFVPINSKKNITMYVIQLAIVLLSIEIFWQIELEAVPKIFITLLSVSYIIFTLERRTGSVINEFSSLDLLIILITLTGFFLSLSGFSNYFWFCMNLFSLWFSTSFILRRTIYRH
jgi:UDP-GlcNAc:undecaprenyl-phosphate GlcNAc-1-phosphate transferase